MRRASETRRNRRRRRRGSQGEPGFDDLQFRLAVPINELARESALRVLVRQLKGC